MSGAKRDSIKRLVRRRTIVIDKCDDCPWFELGWERTNQDRCTYGGRRRWTPRMHIPKNCPLQYPANKPGERPETR